MEVKRLFDIPFFALEKYNVNDFATTKYGDNWKKTSNKEYIDQAINLAKSLIHLGVQPKQKVALITNRNRTEWNLLDTALLMIGAHTVPIYPTISQDEFEYIFNHSEAVMCFVSDQELHHKIQTLLPKINLPLGLFTMDIIDNVTSVNQLINEGKNLTNDDELLTRSRNVVETDLASIIYTSGTTGKPKGVMLSHKNIIQNFMGCQERVPLNFGKDIALSFLPCCHVYERMLIYLYQYGGIGVYYAESIDKIADNIKEVRPNVMCVVPRLLEKVYDRIIEKGANLTGIKRKIFFWAIELAEEFEAFEQNGWWYKTRLKLAKKLVLNQIKDGLGGRLDLIVSGSAPLQPRLARFFTASGMLVQEGYGLTETSPVIAVNSLLNKNYKFGTVGKPLPNVTVKIAADGEILTKSDCVMMGYYKDEEKTSEVIKDGFFHTEDIGELDKEGFLKITDRKKEIFKTSGGKYVAPQFIENNLKESRFIEQVMVVGEGEKMPAAFIVIDLAFVKEWAKRKNISIGDSIEEIAKNELVNQRIEKVIHQINKRFGNWEQVKTFRIIPSTWSIESGELTPTLKLKRKFIKEKYINLYNEMYSNK